jgi:hypothetical protein
MGIDTATLPVLDHTTNLGSTEALSPSQISDRKPWDQVLGSLDGHQIQEIGSFVAHTPEMDGFFQSDFGDNEISGSCFEDLEANSIFTQSWNPEHVSPQSLCRGLQPETNETADLGGTASPDQYP